MTLPRDPGRRALLVHFLEAINRERRLDLGPPQNVPGIEEACGVILDSIAFLLRSAETSGLLDGKLHARENRRSHEYGVRQITYRGRLTERGLSFLGEGESLTGTSEPAPEFRTARWFEDNTDIPLPRLRQAAIRKRKKKKVRKSKIGDVTHYSLSDARVAWPDAVIEDTPPAAPE